MNLAKVGKITAGVALLVVAAGYGALSSIDVENYRDDIIQAAEDATGRDVDIKGPIKLRVSLTPAVVVEGLTMSNAPWATAPQMISIGRAEAEIGLMSAIFGSIEVNKLVVHDASISLQRQKNGKANWVLAPDAPADAAPQSDNGEDSAKSASDADGSGEAPSIAIRSVDIKNLKLDLNDAVSGQALAVNVKALSAEANGFSDPVNMALDMEYNALPIKASGRVGPIENLLANKESKVDLTVSVPGVQVSTKGSIDQPMAAKGVDLLLTIDATSFADIGKVLAADLSGIPAFSLTTKVETFGTAGYRLHDALLKLGEQSLKMNVSADIAPKIPQIKATVQSDRLDIPQLLAGLGGEAPEQQGDTTASAPQTKKSGDGRVFPADPLPLAAMHGVNADASIDIAELIVPSGVKLNDAKVALTLKDGQVMVKPNFGLGGGSVSGKIGLASSKNTGIANLSVNLDSQKVKLAEVAREAGMQDLMSGGATDIDVALTAHGKSVRDLMANLDGSVLVDTANSEIINEKLSQAIGGWAMSGLTMIDPGFAAREKTVMSCMVVRVPISKGMANIDDSIAMETNVLNLVVDGDVNLKTEELDLGIGTQPHGVGTGLAESTAGLVRIGGTLGDPSVGVSLLGAGKAAVRVGAAIATGGLSLVGDAVLNQATKDAHPCQTARGGKAKTPQQPKSTTSGASESQEKNPVKAIDGALKGLFGK